MGLAAELTGAEFSALGVLDHMGKTVLFVHQGVDPAAVALMPHTPRGVGLLGRIPVDGTIVLENLKESPDYTGWPEGHPDMREFLGAPLRINDQVFGRIYLANKAGGFSADDVDTVHLLARAAGVAILNSRIYGQSRARERRMRVS